MSAYCCETFAKALQVGTDSGRWGSLVDRDYFAPHRYKFAGMDEPLNFCPWCAADVSKPPDSPGRFSVAWVDAGREPQCSPNPIYPTGIDLDASGGLHQACTADLPYPAKRCGRYEVECKICGVTAVVTTAGRADDPRSVRLACKRLFSAWPT